MNLKNKIATNMSLLFMLFLGLILTSIYFLFAKFRSDEFKGILSDRISTVANFVKNKRSNNEVIDLNLINNAPAYSLQQEQILVFDAAFSMVYNNIKDSEVQWNRGDLEHLKSAGEIYRRNEKTEIFGKKIGQNFYLIQATDRLGESKLRYLLNLMVVSFLTASALMWVLSFLFAQRMVAPLDVFQKKITNISVNNLNEKLPEGNRKDEINQLASVFNTMLDRINQSYSAQKEFTASASHEIKTPLARMAYRLENLSKIAQDEDAARYVAGIRDEVFQLSDTVDSLLLLSKIENASLGELDEVRLDEAVFEAFDRVKKQHPELEMNFSIETESEENNLTVRGVKPLLEIVFINLFKNAYLYSTNRLASVKIIGQAGASIIEVGSSGETIPEQERQKIFEAFRRGTHTLQKPGSGLGLRISKRIMDYHRAEISYRAENQYNTFVLKFSVPEA